jgi:hypothetical protein
MRGCLAALSRPVAENSCCLVEEGLAFWVCPGVFTNVDVSPQFSEHTSFNVNPLRKVSLAVARQYLSVRVL